MFDEPLKLALGLLTGTIFGFLLQKGRVTDYQVIVGQLLLRDWTVFKVMATAVVVGSVGVYALVQTGHASVHVKPLLFSGVIAGAVLFGIGMAVLGYCPGTGVAACGEGRRDAMVGVLGMFFGAGVFVAVYPALRPLIEGLGDWGEVTLPRMVGVSPWAGVGVLIVLGVTALGMFGRPRWPDPAERGETVPAGSAGPEA
jgi:uncharacterized membrane protein YedE/YeeE